MSCFSGSINNNVNKKVSRSVFENSSSPLEYSSLSSFSLLGKRKGFVLANQRHGLDSMANRSLLAYIFCFFIISGASGASTHSIA